MPLGTARELYLLQVLFSGRLRKWMYLPFLTLLLDYSFLYKWCKCVWAWSVKVVYLCCVCFLCSSMSPKRASWQTTNEKRSPLLGKAGTLFAVVCIPWSRGEWDPGGWRGASPTTHLFGSELFERRADRNWLNLFKTLPMRKNQRGHVSLIHVGLLYGGQSRLVSGP